LQAEIAASDSSISKIKHIQDSSDDQGLALKMHYTTGAGFLVPLDLDQIRKETT